MDYYLNLYPDITTMTAADYYWVILVIMTIILIQSKLGLDAERKQIMEQGHYAENLILKDQLETLQQEKITTETEFKAKYNAFTEELQGILNSYKEIKVKFDLITEEKNREMKAKRDLEFTLSILSRNRALKEWKPSDKSMTDMALGLGTPTPEEKNRLLPMWGRGGKA
jgi:hypothetical protein